MKDTDFLIAVYILTSWKCVILWLGFSAAIIQEEDSIASGKLLQLMSDGWTRLKLDLVDQRTWSIYSNADELI